MAKISQCEFDAKAHELFEQYHIEMIDQVRFLDVDVTDPAMDHQIKWMAKMFAVKSCELMLEYCDTLAEFYWNNVIKSIYNIGKQNNLKQTQNEPNQN